MASIVLFLHLYNVLTRFYTPSTTVVVSVFVIVGKPEKNMDLSLVTKRDTSSAKIGGRWCQWEIFRTLLSHLTFRQTSLTLFLVMVMKYSILKSVKSISQVVNTSVSFSCVRRKHREKMVIVA
jgi:hypothetical protein